VTSTGKLAHTKPAHGGRLAHTKPARGWPSSLIPSPCIQGSHPCPGGSRQTRGSLSSRGKSLRSRSHQHHGPHRAIRNASYAMARTTGWRFPLLTRAWPGTDASGLPGASSSSATTAHRRRRARAVHGGDDRRQVTGTASPACLRRWEIRCRQVTPGVGGISRAPRILARRRCPGLRGRSGPRRSAGPGWPGWPMGRTGRRRWRARSAR